MDLLPPGLYIVGTPIGNLQDITLRALHTLGAADIVFTEDTRRTRALLTFHNLSKPTRSLPAFAERRRLDEIVDRVAAGERVALCTDAGMPGISDPGTATVQAVRSAGLEVVVVPGPSAVTTALAGCGFGGGAFTFLGFLPRTPGKLRRRVAAALETQDPVVFFEAIQRLAKTLSHLAEVTGDRKIVVARELTKLHETWHEGTAGELATAFTATPPRGECTVVIPGE